jgi:hypothetical protein
MLPMEMETIMEATMIEKQFSENILTQFYYFVSTNRRDFTLMTSHCQIGYFTLGVNHYDFDF